MLMRGMVQRRTLTISITPEQDALVRACVRSGRYASASEVMRAALRVFGQGEAAAQATAKITSVASPRG